MTAEHRRNRGNPFATTEYPRPPKAAMYTLYGLAKVVRALDQLSGPFTSKACWDVQELTGLGNGEALESRFFPSQYKEVGE